MDVEFLRMKVISLTNPVRRICIGADKNRLFGDEFMKNHGEYLEICEKWI